MSTPRRSRLEIILDILKVIAGNGSLRPTHIMYKANITWETLKQNLSYLKQLNAINEIVEEDGTYFTATPIGLEVLAHYNRIADVLSEINVKSSLPYPNR